MYLHTYTLHAYLHTHTHTHTYRDREINEAGKNQDLQLIINYHQP